MLALVLTAEAAHPVAPAQADASNKDSGDERQRHEDAELYRRGFGCPENCYTQRRLIGSTSHCSEVNRSRRLGESERSAVGGPGVGGLVPNFSAVCGLYVRFFAGRPCTKGAKSAQEKSTLVG